MVNLLELAAQLPLQVRVDHRQRLVEHDDVDVGAHQAAAQGNLLLAVGGEARCALVEGLGEIEHGGDLGAREAAQRLQHQRDAGIARQQGSLGVDIGASVEAPVEPALDPAPEGDAAKA